MLAWGPAHFMCRRELLAIYQWNGKRYTQVVHWLSVMMIASVISLPAERARKEHVMWENASYLHLMDRTWHYLLEVGCKLSCKFGCKFGWKFGCMHPHASTLPPHDTGPSRSTVRFYPVTAGFSSSCFQPVVTGRIHLTSSLHATSFPSACTFRWGSSCNFSFEGYPFY